MGYGSGFHGKVYGMGRHDGLYAYLLDLLQPALLPEIGVRLLSAAKGTSAPCSESAFCVVPDHTCTNLRERLRYGIHVLLWNEDHELPHGSSRRSEEHTSELQSLTNLVCRLLLEKKK